MLEACTIRCPYCGEHVDIDVDCSAGSQTYYEDCFVCCRPILIEALVEAGALISVHAGRDDD